MIYDLSYQRALHGIQGAIRVEMQFKGVVPDDNPAINYMKHMRTGIDAQKSDLAAIAELLISKGVFTEAEYLEALRKMMNRELERYTTHINETYGMFFNGAHVSFVADSEGT